MPSRRLTSPGSFWRFSPISEIQKNEWYSNLTGRHELDTRPTLRAAKPARIPFTDTIGTMEISELVRTLLSTRGVENDADVAAFLNPDYELHTHDPFLLHGMDIAMEFRVRRCFPTFSTK